jgi:hypothetical protein
MPLSDLLYDRTDPGYARLELAFNLARASQAHLVGAYVVPGAHNAPAGFGLGPPAGMTGRDEEGMSSGSLYDPGSPAMPPSGAIQGRARYCRSISAMTARSSALTSVGRR